MKIYNPVYGVLLEIDAAHPDDTKENEATPLTATSPKKALTSQEIHSLSATGMVGSHSGAFHVVGPPA